MYAGSTFIDYMLDLSDVFFESMSFWATPTRAIVCAYLGSLVNQIREVIRFFINSGPRISLSLSLSYPISMTL